MSDINFLHEMANIRFIQRMWSRFGGAEFANLAEHHFHVFWIAMALGIKEGADTGKIAKMVMVHDIAESRTGDVDYLARQYVDRNDELGIHDMLDDTTLAGEFLVLWEEYDKRESLESRIVKDADNLNVDFELMQQSARGNTLPGQWLHRVDVAKRLFTPSAKALYKELAASNPNEWHMSGRNRVNDGDWKHTKKP